MKIQELTSTEVKAVNGGVCENMSLAECIDGVGSGIYDEISDFFEDLWDDLEDFF